MSLDRTRSGAIEGRVGVDALDKLPSIQLVADARRSAQSLGMSRHVATLEEQEEKRRVDESYVRYLVMTGIGFFILATTLLVMKICLPGNRTASPRAKGAVWGMIIGGYFIAWARLVEARNTVRKRREKLTHA